MYRFTPRDAGFSLFLLDKDTRDDAASDEPYATVPIWRTPQPKPHTHQDHEVNLVVSGACRYQWQVGEKKKVETVMNAGEILAIPGGVSHIVEVSRHTKVRGLWIHPSLLNDVSGAPNFNSWFNPEAPRAIQQTALFDTFNTLFEQAQGEYARHEVLRDEVLRQYGKLAALLFARAMQTAGRKSSNYPTQDRVLDVRAWMERHFLEDATLDDLAQRANLSISQFSQVFRNETGSSPKQFLLDCRLRYAKALIETTELSVSHIAQTCGFSHLSNFNHRFRKRFQDSPLGHRNKHQKHDQKPQDKAQSSL
jgi:AraC-like DNA-binding protein/quercetin dioxygenase-like cupin family protein